MLLLFTVSSLVTAEPNAEKKIPLKTKDLVAFEIEKTIYADELEDNKFIVICSEVEHMSFSEELCIDIYADYTKQDGSIFLGDLRLQVDRFQKKYLLSFDKINIGFVDKENSQVLGSGFTYVSSLNTSLKVGYLNQAGYVYGFLKTDKFDEKKSITIKMSLSFNAQEIKESAYLNSFMNNLKSENENKKNKPIRYLFNDGRSGKVCVVDQIGKLYCWGGINYKHEFFTDQRIVDLFNPNAIEDKYIIERQEGRNGNNYICLVEENSSYVACTVESGGFNKLINDIVNEDADDEMVENYIYNNKYRIMDQKVLDFFKLKNPKGTIVLSLQKDMISLNFEKAMVCLVTAFENYYFCSSAIDKFFKTTNEITVELSKAIQVSRLKVDNRDILFKSDLKGSRENSCFVFKEDSSVKCWGVFTDEERADPIAAQLGSSSNNYTGLSELSDKPAYRIGLKSEKIIKLLGGEYAHCALLDSRRVKCWGVNSNGELGGYAKDGVIRLREAKNALYLRLGPYKVMDIIYHNPGTFCVIFSNGKTKCWGNDGRTGILGIESRVQSIGIKSEDLDLLGYMDLGDKPVQKIGVTGEMSQSMCAVFTDGSVKCWGVNNEGRLAIEKNREEIYAIGIVPDDMSQLSYIKFSNSKVKSIVSNGSSYCVLLDSKGVKCWGENELDGRISANNKTRYIGDEKDEITNLKSLNFNSEKILSIKAGKNNYCALSELRNLYCWGQNNKAQLGLGMPIGSFDLHRPTYSSLNNMRPIRLGEAVLEYYVFSRLNCAILVSNAVKCWGGNESGQTGQDSLFEVFSHNYDENFDPIFLGDKKAMELHSVGYNTICASFSDSSLKCWGNNNLGQSGAFYGYEDVGRRKGDMEKLQFIELPIE